MSLLILAGLVVLLSGCVCLPLSGLGLGQRVVAAVRGSGAGEAEGLASDFSLPTLRDEAMRLSELQGQVVILNFWASWCPPCRAEMLALNAAARRYQDEGVMILAVNVREAPSQVEAFAREQKLIFPILLDRQGSVARQYGVRALPTTLFIDRRGRIADRVVGGPLTLTLIERKVAPLLEEGGD